MSTNDLVEIAVEMARSSPASAWFPEWMGKKEVATVQSDPHARIGLATDLAWMARRQRSLGASATAWPLTSGWRVVEATGDARELLHLLELSGHRFDLRFRELDDALTTLTTATQPPAHLEAWMLALKAFAELGPGRRADLADGLVTIDAALKAASALPVAPRGRVMHICLHALFLGGSGSADDGTASRMVRLADQMTDLGLDDANVHYRKSRALLILGDHEAAMTSINRAIALSLSPDLTDFYIAERTNIAQRIDLRHWISKEVADQMAGFKSDVEAIQDEFEEHAHEVEASIADTVAKGLTFNLQTVFALFSIVAVGGGAVAVSQRIFTVERGQSFWYRFGMASSVTGLVVVVCVALMWSLKRFMPHGATGKEHGTKQSRSE